jgi:hypothetical protein
MSRDYTNPSPPTIGDSAVSSDEQTMQIRKFLKRVGVESHTAIEAALASATSPISLRMELVIEGAESTRLAFDAEIDAAS